ncbi:hypothetical protein F4808DRAFT_333569 [Astrocystis sublimbata]|nr:hypothetical protein F4808DRAFT_333569 [Astrocystis sublimbata]
MPPLLLQLFRTCCTLALYLEAVQCFITQKTPSCSPACGACLAEIPFCRRRGRGFRDSCLPTYSILDQLRIKSSDLTSRRTQASKHLPATARAATTSAKAHDLRYAMPFFVSSRYFRSATAYCPLPTRHLHL